MKRRSLSGKVKSWFPLLTEGERSALMQRSFDERGVYEEDRLRGRPSTRKTVYEEDHRLVYDL